MELYEPTCKNICPICYLQLDQYNYRLGPPIIHKINTDDVNGRKHPMHKSCFVKSVISRRGYCPYCMTRMPENMNTFLDNQHPKKSVASKFFAILSAVITVFLVHYALTLIISCVSLMCSPIVSAVLPGIIAFVIAIKNLYNENKYVGFTSLTKILINDLMVNLVVIMVPLFFSTVATYFTENFMYNSLFTSACTVFSFYLCFCLFKW